MTLKTPLYEKHVQLKARMVDFAGWSMPVFYDSVIREHQHVRNAVGIFDVSHMGEIEVSGIDAVSFLQEILMNDVSKLRPGSSQYSALLNDRGGFVDDLLVYCLERDKFLLCVNASNAKKDYQWIISKQAQNNVSVIDRSNDFAQLAVQGPESLEALSQILEFSDRNKLESCGYTKHFWANLCGAEVLIARTGYTGERGYELYIPNAAAAEIWDKLFLQVKNLKPVGLGARDTLRLESGYLLYGQDMNDEINPLEAGVAWAFKKSKPHFIGKDAAISQANAPSARELVAFLMDDQSIPRGDMRVLVDGQDIGRVTSGSFLPTIGRGGGMALIEKKYGNTGTKLQIDVRGKTKEASVCNRPIYNVRVKD